MTFLQPLLDAGRIFITFYTENWFIKRKVKLPGKITPWTTPSDSKIGSVELITFRWICCGCQRNAVKDMPSLFVLDFISIKSSISTDLIFAPKSMKKTYVTISWYGSCLLWHCSKVYKKIHSKLERSFYRKLMCDNTVLSIRLICQW